LEIGNRLKKLRIKHGLLQKKIAEQLNLSQQTISLYEANKREPDYITLQKIADYFNVSIDYLLGKTDIKEPVDDVIEKKLDIFNQIHTLSPESQKDLKKYIELLKLKEKYGLNNDNK